MNDLIHYDIIGDIHGRFDKFTALMDRLGYEKIGAGFVPPPGNRALFLGDLIDPKPSHALPGGVRATLHAVRAMCDRDDALCLMGNHELNAIYFHSKGPDGKWLRSQSDKNVQMHEGTVADFPDHLDSSGEWLAEWLPWMKRLPFSLDLGGFRAVHATWDDSMISRIDGKSLEDEAFLLAASDKRNPEGEALEVLLKGVEVELPDGVKYTDHTGAIRGTIRARWWELPDRDIGYDGLVFPANPAIPNDRVRPEAFAQIWGYPLDAPPVFFGHYFKPGDSPLRPERENVACLDHSAAKDGLLVSYRWQGCASLHPEHYLTHE
jgi:predicted phosphodiesterase